MLPYIKSLFSKISNDLSDVSDGDLDIDFIIDELPDHLAIDRADRTALLDLSIITG